MDKPKIFVTDVFTERKYRELLTRRNVARIGHDRGYQAVWYIRAALVSLGLASCLSGCGGERESGVISTLSFPLRSGYVNYARSGASVTFNVSGGCMGLASVTNTLPRPTTFEGNVVLSVRTTATISCGGPNSMDSTESYFDGSFMPLGSTGGGYGVYQTPVSLPAAVKIGDTGVVGTKIYYSDGAAKTTQTGRDVLGYVVEPDTVDSAIINWTGESYDAFGRLKFTMQERYRIVADGTMTPVSSEIQYETGSKLFVRMTVVSATATPTSGSWEILPAQVSNDIYHPFSSDMQLAGDGVGNMFLATSYNTSSQTAVTSYQRQLGRSWDPRFDLSPIKTSIGSDYIFSQLRADSAGNAVAAWIDRYPAITSNLQVRNYDSAAGWGPPQIMQANPTEYVSAASLTMQDDGTAWLLWTERTYTDVYSSLDTFALFAANYTPATGWGTPEKVTADYSSVGYFAAYLTGRIATDNSGNPSVLWTDGTTLYSTRKNFGIWEAQTVVAPPTPAPGTVNFITDFDIAVDEGGNAIAAWHQLDSAGLDVVFTNRYVPATGWAGVTAMSHVANNGTNPKLAMDSSGNALLLWSQNVGDMIGLWAARFDHISGWGVPVKIDAPGNTTHTPQIAFDKQGNALAVWAQDLFIKAARYVPNAGWHPDQFISNGAGIARNPRLAVSGNGRATVVWKQEDMFTQSSNLWANDFSP